MFMVILNFGRVLCFKWKKFVIWGICIICFVFVVLIVMGKVLCIVFEVFRESCNC